MPHSLNSTVQCPWDSQSFVSTTLNTLHFLTFLLSQFKVYLFGPSLNNLCPDCYRIINTNSLNSDVVCVYTWAADHGQGEDNLVNWYQHKFLIINLNGFPRMAWPCHASTQPSQHTLSLPGTTISCFSFLLKLPTPFSPSFVLSHWPCFLHHWEKRSNWKTMSTV